ncbi:MAG: hypothetical protein DRJ15_06030 [Bacteroidetes bacterium]|nr:MAG: hypothetical protein DRJ15_06030 [Bacteroidota bacterium]
MTPIITRKLALAILSMVFVLGISARDIVIKENGKTDIELLSNTYHNFSFSSSLDLIQAYKINTEMGIFSELTVRGYSAGMNIGDPKLPMKRKLIEIPFGATPEVRIISFNVQEYSLEELGIEFPVMPAQPPAPKDGSYVPFEYNKATYQHDAYAPQELVSVEVLGVMRGLRLARLDIAPVQYNPVTGMLRVYSDIEAEVVFTGADVMTTLEEKKKNQAPYFNSVGASLLNYKQEQNSNRDTITKYPVKYVIVADPMFQSQLQPFVEWKTQKGFTVIEAYTDDPNVGNTTGSIKTYLQGLYDAGTPADPAPSFVLLVGDDGQVPAFGGVSSWHVTDLYYVEYTGDYFPEVYWGRWSATNPSELQPQIDKTLQYEKYTMPDPAYLDEVVMIAGMDGSYGASHGNGQINYGTINYFNLAHGLTSHTYLYPGSGGQAANIRQNISDGVSFGNYTAHCSYNGWADPSFTITDVANLQNQDEYCVLIGNCCSSNEFNNYCFGEAILRAENKGAVGYIGGTNSTYWDEDYYFGVGVGTISENPPAYSETTLGNYDRSFHDHGEPWEDWYTTTYQMVFAGNLAVTEGAPSSALYYWEIYCVMGDPSVMTYFGVPDPISVSYDPMLMLGATSFTVNTEPYAYVGISKDGVLHGAALADQTGLAVVSIVPFTVPGDADVVVTKQNGAPYIGTVLVNNPAGAYIALNDYTTNDPTGNNNGLVDYGETIALDVILENLGSSDATDVSATLSTTDPLITITDDAQDWGTIAGNSTSTQLSAYAFDVAAHVPDQHLASFELNITGTGKEEWSSTFSVLLNAPVFALSAAIVDDSQSGNGNGRLDAGETADIILPVLNAGHCDAKDAVGTLSSTSGDIVINSGTSNMGAIVMGATENASFNITVDDNIAAGASVMFEFFLDADGYTAEMDFFLVAGQIPVLVLDFDGNMNSGLVMNNCLNNLSVGADYTTIMPNNLDLYASVFVCLGVYSSNHALSANDGQALADFLNAGGKVYMEGGDTWYYDDQTAVHPMFGINGLEDGSDDLSIVNGHSGTFMEGATYVYTGDNNWIDKIEPTGDAFTILSNQSPAYVTGVAKVGPNYKTIGCSHEFGGMSDGAYTKDYLMYKYLEFFDIDAIWVGVDEIELSGNTVNIFPNPASENATIHVSVAEAGNLSIAVYNYTGQEVSRLADNLSMSEGSHTFEFDASGLPGGVYFCVLTSGEQKVTKKIVVIK